MKKLIALLAAIGAVVFFWRKKSHSDDSTSWSSASDTASSWGDSATTAATDAADAVETAVDDATDAK